MPEAIPIAPTRPVAAAPAARHAEEQLKPVPFRGAGFDLRHVRFAAIATFAAVIAAWWFVSTYTSVSKLLLPSPGAVFDAFMEVLRSGELAHHIGASLMRIGIGWLLGASFGVAVGLWMGISSIARSIGVPLVSAIFPIPKIALLPLLILWLGIGETSKIATIALGVFFPIVISTYAGIDDVPRNLIRMGQSFGLDLRAIIRSIVIPGALPGMLAGLRISSSIALLLVVSAEMIGANEGIGAFVLTAGNLMQMDKLIVGVATLSVLGLAIGALLSRLERALLRWR